MNQRITANLAN